MKSILKFLSVGISSIICMSLAHVSNAYAIDPKGSGAAGQSNSESSLSSSASNSQSEGNNSLSSSTSNGSIDENISQSPFFSDLTEEDLRRPLPAYIPPRPRAPYHGNILSSPFLI